MRRAGIDAQTSMRISSHKTMAMFSRYNSFHEDDLKAAEAKMNTYLTRLHSATDANTHNALANNSI
jgi:hypothetical protein